MKAENLIKVAVILFGFYPLMPNNLKGFFMIFLSLSSIIFFIKKTKREKFIKPFIINSALFFIYLISMFYTTDLYNGIKKLGPGISIILFPLIFYVFLGGFKFSKGSIDRLLDIFSFSTATFMIIFIFYYQFKILPLFPDISIFDVNYIRTHIRLIPMIGHHPIYVSIFLGISIIHLTSKSSYLYKKNKNNFYISFVLLIFNIFSLFYISSKGAIFSLIIISFIIYFIKSSNKYKAVFWGLISFCIIIVSIFSIPHLNRRFKELIKEKTYFSKELDQDSSTQIRLAIWKTSVNNIKKAPILGYGIGDVKGVLDNSYKYKYPFLIKENHNSHNQYFGIWLSAGIVGLIIFLLMLSFNYRLAYLSKDYRFLALLLFFSLIFLTENVIERQTGAILFFFFVNLFGYNSFIILREKNK